MVEFLYKSSTLWVIRIAGMVFLVSYLLMYQDFSFSLTWSLLHVAIVLGVATGITSIGIQKLIPSLGTYYIPRKMKESVAENLEQEDDPYRMREAYMESLFNRKTVAFLAAEDGLIGVPLILLGINPLSVIIAGIVFGVIQLPRFTYLECLIKGMTYMLICLLVLPNGILTVVAGHYLTDVIVWLGFKLRK